MRLRFYRQPPLRGGRTPLPSCVNPAIYQEVDRRAKKHKTSRSWVIATHLAESFGMSDDQPDYRKSRDAK